MNKSVRLPRIPEDILIKKTAEAKLENLNCCSIAVLHLPVHARGFQPTHGLAGLGTHGITSF